jgi:hypothetical protein
VNSTLIGLMLTVSALSGCDRSPFSEPKLVQEVRASGERAAAASDKGGKYAADANRRAIGKAYAQAVADGKSAIILEYVKKSVKAGGQNGIAHELQAQIVFDLISRPDKPQLATVLSWGSTDFSSYWCIEEELTRDDPSNKITDGLDVLFDAYVLSESAAAKDANYVATWRALGDLPIKTPNADEYMRVARSWYAENRSRLVRLGAYDYTDFVWWRAGDRKGQEPRHLFELPKASVR